MNAATGLASKYRVSPLAEYDRAVETASALLVMQVSPASIAFELRREHGLTEAQSAAVIRDARCVATA